MCWRLEHGNRRTGGWDHFGMAAFSSIRVTLLAREADHSSINPGGFTPGVLITNFY